MRRLSITLLPTLIALGCAGLLADLAFSRPSPPPAAAAATPAAAEGVAAAALDGEPKRRPVETTRPPLRTAPIGESFERRVDRLVAIAVKLRDARADLDQQLEWNAQAEELLREMPCLWVNAGQLALDGLLRLSVEPGAEPRLRGLVLERIAGDALDELWGRVRRGEARGRLDALVAATLQTIAAESSLAPELTALLLRHPCLGAAHEALVLELARQAADEPELEEVAAALLRSLWRNLRDSGARSESELAALALMLQDDLNPCRRLAALQELLSAADGRYREMVLSQVRRSGDRELAREVAMVAAAELEPEQAVDALDRLHELAGIGMLGAWMTVGERDAESLLGAYEQHLADATRPALRADLVSGACTAGGPEAAELVRTAFEHDPSAEVRGRALLALAADQDPRVAERSLCHALDDPRTARDPAWLGTVVTALGNLRDGPRNAETLRRIGARLQRLSELSATDRDRLRMLLEQRLPRGG